MRNLINASVFGLPDRIPGVGVVLMEKKIQSQSYQNMSSLYIFRDLFGKKYIVKSAVFFRRRNFVYKQLKKEAEYLKMFGKLNYKNKTEKRFVDLIWFKERKNQIILVTKYISSIDLENSTKKSKIQVLTIVFDYFEELTSALTKKEVALFPKKSNLFIFCAFHYLFLFFIFKNPKLVLRMFKFASVFYRSIFSYGQIFRTKYVVAHRDLHSNNILVTDNNFFIVDLDNCALCPTSSDLAMLPGYYYKELGRSDILRIIIKRLRSSFAQKQFLYLLIFYFLIKQNTESRFSRFYVESAEYLDFMSGLIEALSVD